MYNEVELNQRMIIIKHSELEDATILEQNYRNMMRGTDDPIEQTQYITLRTNLQERIKQLEESI
jgi:hypothetical protein